MESIKESEEYFRQENLKYFTDPKDRAWLEDHGFIQSLAGAYKTTQGVEISISDNKGFTGDYSVCIKHIGQANRIRRISFDMERMEQFHRKLGEAIENERTMMAALQSETEDLVGI